MRVWESIVAVFVCADWLYQAVGEPAGAEPAALLSVCVWGGPVRTTFLLVTITMVRGVAGRDGYRHDADACSHLESSSINRPGPAVSSRR